MMRVSFKLALLLASVPGAATPRRLGVGDRGAELATPENVSTAAAIPG